MKKQNKPENKKLSDHVKSVSESAKEVGEIADGMQKDDLKRHKTTRNGHIFNAFIFTAMFTGAGFMLHDVDTDLQEMKADPEALAESFRDACFDNQVEDAYQKIENDSKIKETIARTMKGDEKAPSSILIQFNKGAETSGFTAPEGTKTISATVQEDKAKTESCMKDSSEGNLFITNILHNAYIGLSLVCFLMAAGSAYAAKKHQYKIKEQQHKPPML